MPLTDQVDEQLIWHNFRNGDEKAYANLFSSYFQPLYQYGLNIHPDPSLVKDCLQELFIKIWRLKENLIQPTSVQGYLQTSLRRTILTELARKHYKLHNHLAEDYHFEVVLSHEWQLINKQVSEERLLNLEQALKKLTKRQRDAIHLKFFGKLSYEEIAEIMELNVRSVYNLISKALDILYQEIKQYNDLQAIIALLLGSSFVTA